MVQGSLADSFARSARLVSKKMRCGGLIFFSFLLIKALSQVPRTAHEIPLQFEVVPVHRVTLIHRTAIDSYFADWLRPLLFTLDMFVETNSVAIEDAKSVSHEVGDVVLVLQRVETLTQKRGVIYWFLNTEGPDKHYAEEAIQRGFVDIIDYCLSNVQYLLQRGARRVLWLPIIFTPGVRLHVKRDAVCLVGGTNTGRRAKFKTQLERTARLRLHSVKLRVREVYGWGFERDLLSQECALAVNLASVETNHAVPRMRLDILWQYDIPTISEDVLPPDSVEYLNTITFVPREQLVDATLKAWVSLAQSPRTRAEYVREYKLRVQVQEHRELQFKRTVSSILARSTKNMSRNSSYPSIVHNCSLGEEM